MPTFVKVEGVKELRERLSRLEVDVRKRLLVNSIKKSLDQMLMEAKGRAPHGSAPPWGAKGGTYKGKSHPGYLKESFRIRKMPAKDPSILEVQLQNTAYTALWVEYGHRLVKGRKKGKKRTVGAVAAQPFMRPTYENNKEAVIGEVVRVIQAKLTRKGV